MGEERWDAVDRWITDRLVPPDPALDGALAASDAAGLPPIAVAPNQGKLLNLLARLRGARRILEIGTLGGYSTIWLARAGLAEAVELRLGPALDSLARLAEEKAEPFDLIFVDADKPNNPHYFAWAMRLSRPGTLIVLDNMVRAGGVLDGTDAGCEGVRRTYELIAAEPRVASTAVQTVGLKGWDGLALVLVER